MADTIDSLQKQLKKSQEAHTQTLKELREMRMTFDVLVAANALDRNSYEKANDLVTGFNRSES